MRIPRIFLVDDSDAFLSLFKSLPEADHFEVMTFNSGQAVMEALAGHPPDLIISDVAMPQMDGIELFHKVRDLEPDLPFIFITAFGTTEQAVQAVQHGAFHYFEKPLTDKLPLFWTTVREALAKGEMSRQLAVLKKQRESGAKPDTGMIGRSEAIGKVIESIETVAGLPATVLITGETGTGKELAAQMIHQQSGRLTEAFFAVSCGEFSPGVLESELFGHERGAFTGAIEQRKGFFEMADQGTLFLDEISDAPTNLQAKLLRVLESKQISRVGGTMSISSDFRLIAATNQDLDQRAIEGKFRKDLLYRIKVYEIEMPPLRRRREDIPLLAEFYLKHFSQAYGREADGISEAATLALRGYDWPGNVRELINVVERAVIICKGDTIATKHLPFGEAAREETLSNLDLASMEKFYVELALKRTNGNKTQAAKLLGISRKTLIEKAKKYQLSSSGPA